MNILQYGSATTTSSHSQDRLSGIMTIRLC